MHKLNDQWIEIIDGVEHMVKAVAIESEKDSDCGGCTFYRHGNFCGHPSMVEEGEPLSECPISKNVGMVAKDLGILRDGCLPCPFCGEHPGIGYSEKDGFTCGCMKNGLSEFHVVLFASLEVMSEQEAKDEWNRRS